MSEDLISKLINPSKFWSRSEMRTKLNPVPNDPGVYAWWFDTSPCDSVPLEGVKAIDGKMLLYVGKAGTSLRIRLNQHFGNRAGSSTVRRTLGAFLFEELILSNENAGTKSKVSFRIEGEKRLTEWIIQHAVVSWIVCNNPKQIESLIVKQCILPLNIQESKSQGALITKEKRKILK